MQSYCDEAEKILMHTYGRYQIVFDKGEGVYLYDINGKKYLDFAAGIAVFALGYKNEVFNDALKAQIDKLLHTSNYYYNIPSLEAAKKITQATGMDRVFFTNSGAEAVEGAIKLARKYYYKKRGQADSEMIAMNHSFHGRTMGAVSVTGNTKYREAFEPLIGGVKFAEYNNLDSVKALINDKTSAIILETVQGEGGIYPATKEFIQGIRKLCDEHDICMILDEIQCGMGRTGTMFAYEAFDVLPDIMTCAKALGCGVPVGAFLAIEKVASAFEPGDHGSTYGGNPFVCAAINKVFDLYDELHVLDNVKTMGAYLEEQLDLIVKDYDIAVCRRGKGLMQGIEFNVPVKNLFGHFFEEGLVLIAAGSNVVRFVPPLIITKENVDEMIGKLRKVLDSNTK